MRRRIEDRLVEWKNRQRMPLLLYGARQVGKTYVLTEFGEKYFEKTVYINLEINPVVAGYFENDISPDRLIRFLEATSNDEIIPGKTLIIFDEIQSCERALTSLKYFCELAPEYHVAAAGSLLGVAVNRGQFSFPVGKVESMTLYPMDFEEFLWAMGEYLLAELIREHYDALAPMPEALHNKAIEYYRYYLIIGGMPAVVEKFAIAKKLVLIPNVQNDIIANYVADMAKYANPTEVIKIRACFDSIPAQLSKENKKFQYKIVQKGGSTSLFGASIDWLAQAGLVLKIHRIEHAYNPIAVYKDLTAFKLYMNDVGLLALLSGIPQQSILTGEGSAFMGAITENFIAQSLIANGHSVFYWTSEHTSELDFVLQIDSDIIGCEVKKGIHTKSKSLNVFISKYHPGYTIRFSEKNFGKSDNLLSLPHYSAFCV